MIALDTDGTFYDDTPIGSPEDLTQILRLCLPGPFDPKKAPPIPYSPPTKFNPEADNPFGNILDTPLN